MKVLVTWQINEDKFSEILSRFSHMTAEQEQALMGEHMKIIGRWHDVVRGTGAAVYEADSVEAVSAYALHWNSLMELDLSLVLDDDECKALGLKMEDK